MSTDDAAGMRPRKYVLLVSGSMNPPHRGHVRLGLHAAEHLRAQGHTIAAIAYCPVHDNYLANKLALKAGEGRKGDAGGGNAGESGGKAAGDALCFPMQRRCAMLRQLLRQEASPLVKICRVVDFERTLGSAALERSAFWERLLPQGYLRTLPTASLIAHFVERSPLLTERSELKPRGKARVAVVLGVDNLASLPAWVSPGQVLERSDLVIVARAMSAVNFSKDPSALLKPLKHLHVCTKLPVRWSGESRLAPSHWGAESRSTLFGESVGYTQMERASGDGALFLLPPLIGEDEHLSSTASLTFIFCTLIKEKKLHGESYFYLLHTDEKQKAPRRVLHSNFSLFICTRAPCLTPLFLQYAALDITHTFTCVAPPPPFHPPVSHHVFWFIQALRNGVAQLVSVLSSHGFGDASSAQMVIDARRASKQFESIRRRAAARGELVARAVGAPQVAQMTETAQIEIGSRKAGESIKRCGENPAMRLVRRMRRGLCLCAQPRTS